MKAIVQTGYGSPDVLELRDVELPVIGDDGVLVRVSASSVNAQDWHLLRGQPRVARLMPGFGLRRPQRAVPGADVAGVVEAVGKNVTELRPGDEVFGARSGAFAEYVAGRVPNFAPKPANLSFEQAAAMPVAAITALQALRDHGHVEAGQRVLILGAGGGVGSFAVQLATAFGATVTAVTTTHKLEMVHSIGADEAIDHTRDDVTRSGRRFDVILDVGGYASLPLVNRSLAPGGTAVLVGAGNVARVAARLVAAKVRSRLLGQRLIFFLAHVTRDDLLVLADLAAAGKIVPVIDRTYPLREAPEAVRYFGTGQAGGKVVITV
jgi:2-desacetyl-2-hydroxyethyl bacteriochlorophyllide A dehydrogenase